MMLDGKVAVITGAATGIGQVGAGLFAEEGAKIVIADIKDKEGEAEAERLRSQGKEATYVHCDVASVPDLQGLVESVASLHGRLDILWHNAGLSFPGHIDLVDEMNYDKEMATDLKSAVFLTKFAIVEMRKAGGGCILYTSSMVGLRPTPYSPSYSLTHMIAKSGLVMLSRSLVQVLGEDNIRVNCVCPGPTRTPRHVWSHRRRAQQEGLSEEEFLRRSVERVPLRKEMTMEDIGHAAVFLCSDRASSITGVALAVDGGFSAL